MAEFYTDSAAAQIKSYFEHTGHSDLFSSFIEPDININKTVLTKTNSRSVLATMRSNISHIPFIMNFLRLKQNQSGMFALNDKINKTPSKSQYAESDYIFPRDFISSEIMKQPVPDSPVVKRKKTEGKNIYKIKAQLCGFEKEIWREFIINKNTTMENLAFALMAMFNMDGSHLYKFEIDRQKQKEKELRQAGVSQKKHKGNVEICGQYRN